MKMRTSLSPSLPMQKVLTVIHFNISEADEYLVKGITKKNSWLFNHLVNTEKNTLPNVDKSIFVSQFMCNVVQERLAITKKTPHIVIPNFIEDTTDSLKKSDSIKDIITIGTLESRKNQAFILHVLAACNARGKFYTLTIIGDGSVYLLRDNRYLLFDRHVERIERPEFRISPAGVGHRPCQLDPAF